MTTNARPLRIHNAKAPMPIGIDDFAEVINQQFCLIDKTLFIKEFLSTGDKVTLIPRPRRFGKSLTLSMLQHFLAAEVNRKPTKGLFDGLHHL